ncbi:B3 domain-containing protein Os01g0723500 [Sesamum indicum]|uniref:B3 domain-containing protein Os01g0723500 n=1 Tax=Sesamum indicum TaxID=4182 RepID=A0A6I9TKV7_SESIN|nr:B3 domain-containing protein Os01g0723500 [Sesamum indicum]XP_020551022.1 B3 domain-containing protein Os01g0723500 [Sesamum indicum]
MWDLRRPHFITGFDPSLCSERLNIPCSFIKHMEGRAPGLALLVGPSGNNWYVGLIIVDNGLFLNDGWADFVRDHFLEQGDSLVFRYDGNLHFTVQIFDRSLCEKEAAFSAESSQDLSKYDISIVKKREREKLALLDSIIEGVPKKMRCSQMQSESMCKDHENNTSAVNVEEWMQQADGNSNLRNAVTVALPLTAVPHDNPDPSVRNRTTKLDMLLSASEAERIARSFTSSFPNFLKVMKRFNISGSYTLNVPYQFATEHLPKCKVKIVLRNLKGDSWTVNSIPTTKVQTSHTFCGGWLSFVRDNNIDIGDICIFELVRKFELHVRILRVGKEGIVSHDGEAAKLTNGCTTSAKMSRRKSKKISESVHSIKGSALCSQSNNCIAESEIHKRFGSLDKQGSHTKGCMSMKSAPEEKIAAQYFVSNYPHFVRVMKKFNVSGSYTLKIPYQFSMEHLPNYKTEIVLHNLNGQCWTVNSIPTIKVQTLHTFCGGWMAFVRDNDIQMGDICIFELVGKCEMRVHICGIGKKGLNYQNGTRNLPMP